jgi:hypothetical protein
MDKPIYNSKDWVLGYCTNCGRLNYVEPHGRTAECKCSVEPSAIKVSELSDGSKTYEVVLWADGTKIVFGCLSKFDAIDLVTLLNKQVAWIEVGE